MVKKSLPYIKGLYYYYYPFNHWNYNKMEPYNKGCS
jgi:hypothetical protein